MKKVRRLFCLAAVCMAAVAANAQDKVEGTIATDVVNQYIWRGQDLGDVSVQPTLGVAYKGVSLTAWGNVGLSDKDDTKEFDLTLAYTTGGFHIGVTDYWFNSPNDKYFEYATHKTSHVFEGNIGYDFGPVALNWYTNFAGNDGLNKSGDRAYSSYVEATAPFKACLSRLDSHGGCRALRHLVLQSRQRLCRDQPRSEGQQGHRHHQVVLCACVRRHHGQPKFAEGLLHLWLHAASVRQPEGNEI